MHSVRTALYFALSTLAVFLYVLVAPTLHLTPQVFAGLTLALTISWFYQKQLNLYLLNAALVLLVLSSGGLTSPWLFVLYFILFLSALQNHPLVILVHSLSILVVLMQFVTKLPHLITLLSLVIVSPLIYFTSKLNQDLEKTANKLSTEQTNVLFWLSLSFKRQVQQNLEILQKLSSETNNSNAKKQIETLTENHKNFLKTGQKIINEN